MAPFLDIGLFLQTMSTKYKDFSISLGDNENILTHVHMFSYKNWQHCFRHHPYHEKLGNQQHSPNNFSKNTSNFLQYFPKISLIIFYLNFYNNFYMEFVLYEFFKKFNWKPWQVSFTYTRKLVKFSKNKIFYNFYNGSSRITKIVSHE